MAVTTYASLGDADPITAGDTLLITETLSSYSAASWTLFYYIKKGAFGYRLKGTASGTDHAFTLGSEITGQWPAGQYVFQKYVEDSTGQRITLLNGSITVEPNIALTDPDLEEWREILVFATAAIKRLAKERIVSYSVAGQSYTLTNVGEAIHLERVAKVRVKELEREERRAAGLQSSRRVQFKM